MWNKSLTNHLLVANQAKAEEQNQSIPNIIIPYDVDFIPIFVKGIIRNLCKILINRTLEEHWNKIIFFVRDECEKEIAKD